jgi:hypothetical protein
VIGGGGAAGQQKLGECNLHCQLKAPGCQPRPHGVQVLQPGEQWRVGHRTPSPGEGLVEVVVRVDEAGENHVGGGIKDGRRGSRLPARRHELHYFSA